MLYAAMLEDGSLTPRMLLPDVPTHYDGFAPENFDRQYRGAVRADEALAASLNMPAVRMLKAYGVARFADLLRGAGMTTLTRPADDYGLTLILGGAEGNLWDISAMYASLADVARAGAADAAPRFHELTILHGVAPRSRRATIGTGAAWLTLDALLEVPRPGEEGHWKTFASSRRIAWKTGTSVGLRDGWAVGNSSPPHRGRVGGQCQRRRPTWPHRLHHGRAADVWLVQFAARAATGSRCRSTRSSASRPAPTTASSPTATATSRNAPGYRVDSHFDALSPHNLRVQSRRGGQTTCRQRLRIPVGR